MLTVRTHTSLDPDLLAEIARDQGTPTYVYDGRVLDAGVRRWVDAVGDPARICYAVKANYNLGVLSRLASHEVEAAVRAGAFRAGHSAKVGLRVRPGIRAGAHPSLETSRADAKFGFDPSDIRDAWVALAAADGLEPTTLAIHLGSGLDSLQPYEGVIDVLLRIVEDLKSTRAPVRELDLGGGLGVAYDEWEADLEPADLVRIVEDRLAGTGLTVRYEPGRSIAAHAGTLVTRVLYRRERDGHPALICDGGFTDFGRFALYGAEHGIDPVAGEFEGPATVEVLGPTCESGDKLGTGRCLHGVRPGDLLVVRDVGAYGFVMASNYNARPRPAELLVDDSGWRVVRAREALEDLWRGEIAG